MIQKNAFSWTLAQAVLWQIERLKVVHQREFINVQFFNQHNVLTPMKLLTLPYIISSATKDFKGFELYGVWIGMDTCTPRQQSVIVIPDEWDSFVRSLYKKETNFSLLNAVDFCGLQLKSLEDFNFIETRETDTLLEGLTFLRRYTDNELIEASDEGFRRIVLRNSVVLVLWTSWESIWSKQAKPGAGFALKSLSSEVARHQFAQKIDNRILS